MYGTAILLSESTYELVKDRILCRPLDTVCVVGMSRPSKVYELLCPLSEARDYHLKFASEFKVSVVGCMRRTTVFRYSRERMCADHVPIVYRGRLPGSHGGL